MAAGLVFALLTLAFFAPVLAGRTSSTVPGHQSVIWPWRAIPTQYSDAFPQSDQADTFHPWQTFIGRTLRSGTIPLWNRHSFGGAPFLVNGQNGALYPPRALLSLVLPASWVHDLLLILHVFFAGVAMYALLRQLRCSWAGALFGAMAWMLNSHMLAWMQLEFIVVVAVFLPATVVCLVRFSRRSSWRPAAAAASCIAMMMLGSQVLLAIVVSAACLIYAVSLLAWTWLRESERSSLRQVIRRLVALPVVLAFGCSLAAVVLMPTALAAGDAGREPSPYHVLLEQFSTPITSFRHALWPPNLPFTQPQLLITLFIGTATVVLAALGALTRRRGAGLGLGFAVATVLLCIGTPLTWLAYHLLPGFPHFRPLGKLLFFFDFGIAVLAALGLDALLRWRHRMTGGMARVGRPAVAFVAVASFLATAGQLLWYGRQVNPPFPPRQDAHLYPRTPLIAALEADRRAHPPQEPQRFIPIARTASTEEFRPPVLYTSQAMVFGLDSAAGYESVVPQRVVDLWRVIEGGSPDQVLASPLGSAYVASFRGGATRLDLLPRLGVTTVVGAPDLGEDASWDPTRSAVPLRPRYSGPDGLILDLAGRQDAAWVVFSSEVRADRAENLRRFVDASFDARTKVLLEKGRAETAATGGAASVQRTRRGTNSVSVDVRSSRPGWLVLADTWAPGWTARVDGRTTDVLRANYTFRAVRIPAGQSHVVFSYRPPGFALGALVSLISWGGLAVASVVGVVRSRRTTLTERKAGT